LNKTSLFITIDGLSDPLGQSQILPYVCGLAAKGFPISIISCEKPGNLKKEKENIKKLIKNLPISWHYLLYDEEGGIFSRYKYVKQLKSLAETERKKQQITHIHCRSYLAALVGLSFKYKYNIPFLFDMRGFWPDERFDGNIWQKHNIIHRLFYIYFKKKEKQFILNSGAIVSLTHAAVNELEKKYPAMVQNKTTVIPCCVNTNLFQKTVDLMPKQINNMLSQDHVIIYIGSIGTWYYTREMIDCMLIWKKKIPNIKLLILTKDTNALENILETYNQEQRSIIVSASAGYRDVPSYLALAKASIFFIKPAYSKIASSPTKMAECWSMDLPIITNSGIGDSDLYFNKYNGGILLNEFNDAAYNQACEKYLRISSEPGKYRELAVKYFNVDQAVEDYVAIYKKLSV